MTAFRSKDEKVKGIVYKRGYTMAKRLLAVMLFVVASFQCAALAHPLGNFTVNHFARVEVGTGQVSVRYVVDMAEIPAFQELRAISSGGESYPTHAELHSYLQRAAAQYADGLLLTVDGARVHLKNTAAAITTPEGAGGLQTLRLECDYEGALTAPAGASARRVRFEDTNYSDRTGWREIVVRPAAGVTVFDSEAFASGITDEIKAYPEERLLAPLDERAAEFSFTLGAAPAGAQPLRTREGKPFVQERDRFSELIVVPELTLLTALLGLLIAAGLGAVHALSPGHGKAVVGAYLIGSRGTARHALFLGLTVTVTHTLGIFALGLVTLFASQYVVPERLFPVMSLVSGALVLAVGLSLFVRRLRPALAGDHAHTHEHADGLTHSHGGREHTHAVPEGGRVTWRGLLALGISGGLLPCPSALVVMLSAIAMHRVGYGLILVLAFSLGLAFTLTSIGLMFVYAGRLMKERVKASERLLRWLPAASAFVISCLGAVICYRALREAGINPLDLLSARPADHMGGLKTYGLLGLGFIFGLKHAVEADHIAAVSTMVSGRRGLLGSTLVGGLWGVGHTISLLVAGVAVILLQVRIGERAALALEFCVALMLVALGADAMRKLGRGGQIHFHTHRHGGRLHSHPHIHDPEGESEKGNWHHGLGLSPRPLFVGMVHGLAGSAALMLLVLSTIPSPTVGMLYVLVFGVGSVGGMMLMSLLVSLPMQLAAGRFARAHLVMRGLAGLFSLSFGLLMAYRIGFTDGLFR